MKKIKSLPRNFCLFFKIISFLFLISACSSNLSNKNYLSNQKPNSVNYVDNPYDFSPHDFDQDQYYKPPSTINSENSDNNNMTIWDIK